MQGNEMKSEIILYSHNEPIFYSSVNAIVGVFAHIHAEVKSLWVFVIINKCTW